MFHLNPYENEMAKLFWGQIPIERATAFFYYEAHAETANILYDLKYKNYPEIGEVMGRMFAREIESSGFFDGIDGILPVPLAKKRQHQRGYNQSQEIARGVSAITNLPVFSKVVRRTNYKGSQTSKGRWVAPLFTASRTAASVSAVSPDWLIGSTSVFGSMIGLR